ncbi:hypothetical protein AB833_16140 [Chromatiales bacterium (ex Bugula neritina AB1)]|nr:hypothetical protein AB833_16140 [Chromatiales bacterium (ex Bugula neritina AB1)]
MIQDFFVQGNNANQDDTYLFILECAMIRLLGVTGLFLLLAACGGGGSGGGSSSDNSLVTEEAVRAALSSASVDVRQMLYNYMDERYLWYREMPDLNLQEGRYADLELLLEELRKKPEDRFSALSNAVSQGQRFQQGVAGSFGLRFSLRSSDPLDIRIATVDDFGSVALAGIQRGDRVIGTADKTIDELGVDGFTGLFSEPGLGVQRTLKIRHPDGREQDYIITRTEHALNPVRKQNVFFSEISGRQIGYVMVEEFIRQTAVSLADFRQNYGNLGLDDLIVDLRYNGGGLIYASRDLASTIYGQGQTSDTYTVLQHNDKHSDNDFTYNFVKFDGAFQNLSRVFILTTANTCSASEEVINGLKPFMEVITIGSGTCGKPYASQSYPLIPDLINANILDSRSVNALGEGDFFQGFSPTCAIDDDATLPFTDARESLISAALYYADNGRCPDQVMADSTRGARSIRIPGTLLETSEPVTAQGAIRTTSD